MVSLSPENKKLLEDLGRTSYGKALRTWLAANLANLGDITECRSWEETLGRQGAVKLIKELFYFMEEKKVQAKTKNPYV